MFAVAFGGGSIAFLWPEVRKGFGAKIVVGKLTDILATIDEHGRHYDHVGRFYLVRYEVNDPDGFYARAGVVAGGIMALYQKCSHLGRRTPYCKSSGWFECPCHGARFNGAGEVMNGPAPASLWRFPIEIQADGNVVVDTLRPIAQTPWGYDTIGLQPKGAFCISD